MDTYFPIIKKKAGLTLEDLILFNKPTIYSKPLAKMEKGRLIIIKKCKNDWCKIKTGKYSGWLEKIKYLGKIIVIFSSRF